jgi:hypothetical protein
MMMMVMWQWCSVVSEAEQTAGVSGILGLLTMPLSAHWQPTMPLNVSQQS